MGKYFQKNYYHNTLYIMSINEVDAFEAKANSKDPLVNEGDLEEDNDEDEPYVDPDTIQRDGMF